MDLTILSITEMTGLIADLLDIGKDLVVPLIVMIILKVKQPRKKTPKQRPHVPTGSSLDCLFKELERHRMGRKAPPASPSDRLEGPDQEDQSSVSGG
jgi:hypothetical protein